MSNLESWFFYISAFLISAFFCSLHKSKNVLVKYIGIIVAIVIPSVVAGKRYLVGTDFATYDFFFSNIRDMSWVNLLFKENRWEIGFRILVKCLSFIGSNEVIFGSISFIMLSFFLGTILRICIPSNIALYYFIYLCYYYTFSLNNVRQCLALSIVFWASQYVWKGELKKFLIWIGFASMFHMSALGSIFIYWLWDQKKHKNITKKKIYIIMSFAVIATIFWRNLLQFFIRHIGGFITKYSYLMNNNDARNREFYIKLLLAVVFILLYRKFEQRDNKNVTFIYLYFINVIISYVGFQITFAKRLALYYEIPYVLLVGQIPNMFKKISSRRIMSAIIVILYIIYFTVFYLVSGHSEIFPYQWRSR